MTNKSLFLIFQEKNFNNKNRKIMFTKKNEKNFSI